MEQDKKITYTVKHPGRLVLILVLSVGIILLALAWALFLGRITRRTADLAAFTTLTRSGETVTAVLDMESLLAELELPNPRVDEKALKNGAVRALLNMQLELAFTEEPDVMTVTALVSEGRLKCQGITLKEKTWTAAAKVLPRTGPQEETPEPPQEVEHPKTIQTEGYLSSLLDEEGKGLNLRKVCERVHFERDRLSKEIFGSSYLARKEKVYFLIYPAGSQRRNCYRAVYSLRETGAQEGRSVGSCYFTVDVLDLMYGAGTGVDYARSEVAMYDSLAEALDLSGEFAGCAMFELTGGSVVTEGRPTFDYNGMVRFVGLPMSHPLPDGSLWSPSYDLLEEDDLWRLVGNGEYAMTELLEWVAMEIYARHGYTFPDPGQEAYRAHYSACYWYSPTEDAPERFMTTTERRNLELVRDLKALLDA